MASDVACHHLSWTGNMVERLRAWHAINALRQHTRKNDVGAWHDITALGQHTRSKDVGRGMTSPRLGSTHGQTTSGVACHHRLWEAQKDERRQAWHANITFGQHTPSNYVVRGMPSSPLGSTNGRTTSGVACQHHVWGAHTVERDRAWHASIAFGQHKVERRRAWHDITSFRQHTR